MRNLIITPVYNAFDKVKECCEAIDKLSEMPFMHVLIDDDSPEGDLSRHIEITDSRKVLQIKRDNTHGDNPRKNGQGQAMQMGYDWAHYSFINEQPMPTFDNVFLIESDVIMIEQGWDRRMIELSSTLPSDWATLDLQSVDKDGKLTYPTVVAPRHGYITPEIEHMHYADFQCTLFHPSCFEYEKGSPKWSDFPCQFDILWGRKLNEVTGRKHYRTMLLSAFHYAFSSRRTLPGVEMGPSNER